MEPSRHGIVIEGDARGSELSYGRLLHTADPAHPITCCALAGYLGFSALAHAVGIPGFHEECREPLLRLPFSPSVSEVPPFSVLGTGQLGQAFLALTYFLSGRTPVSVHLLDRELFEDFNQRTQILLSERIDRWSGKPKSEYLADICRTWGWNVFPERKEIQWSWKHGGQGQPLAFLGFDNMDARRIAVEGGFQWIFECGVGTDFCQPRVSWHSIPPERLLAKTLFADVARKTAPSAFAGTLSESPAECGRVIFENIQASAPSLGLVAVALTWVEIARFLAGGQEARSGAAYLWSPLLPLHRELLNPLFVEPKAA